MSAVRERPVWMAPETEFRARRDGSGGLIAWECCGCGASDPHIEHIEHAMGCPNAE